MKGIKGEYRIYARTYQRAVRPILEIKKSYMTKKRKQKGAGSECCIRGKQCANKP